MYVVIGGSGYLGSYFLKNLLDHHNDKIIATYNNIPGEIQSERIKWIQLDVGNIESIEKFTNDMAEGNENYTVFYLAAYHNPDQVLKNFDFAWNINITGLSYVLSHMPRIRTLYYASTEMVYGESIGGHIFFEEDNVCPINEYGKQKVLAETLVLAKGFNVVRYSVLMGKSISGKKHFTDIILENVKNEKMMEMLDDTYRNMIDFDQAADLTIQLADKYKSSAIGIINVVADKIVSKYDMALQLTKSYNLNCEYIKPINIEDNTFFSAQRAKCLFVSNRKLKTLLNKKSIEMTL